MAEADMRDLLTQLINKTGYRPTQFWDRAMVVAPVATVLVFCGLFAWLAGGMDVFEFFRKSVTPFQAFSLLGLMLFPISAFRFAQGEFLCAQAIASRDWPTVQGTVTKSAMRRRYADHGVTWALDFACNYQVGGQAYVVEHVQFGIGRTSSRDLILGFTEKYPVGANVAVRYDPASPEIAALESSEEMARYGLKLALGLFWPPPVAALVVALTNGF
jgi:hypothetical protein